MISIKLQSNFIEIALRHECSPVNLLHMFRTPFQQNTSEWLLITPCKFPKHPYKNKHQKALAKRCWSSSRLDLFLIGKNDTYFIINRRRRSEEEKYQGRAFPQLLTKTLKKLQKYGAFSFSSVVDCEFFENCSVSRKVSSSRKSSENFLLRVYCYRI